nr:hypothetical protein P5629_07835 [Bacillus subtilis]
MRLTISRKFSLVFLTLILINLLVGGIAAFNMRAYHSKNRRNQHEMD